MKGKSVNAESSSKPYAPDLSYKHKETDDLLIDTEANYVESKYHFSP